MKVLLLEGEKVGDPVRFLFHWELPGGGGGVLGVCDSRVVEVEEVDGSLGGHGPRLWRPLFPYLAPSGRRSGAQGPFAGWWAPGWAWCGEALAQLWGEISGILGASVNLVLGGDASDGLGAVEVQGVALWLVWGAAALVELLLAVPLHPDLHPLFGPGSWRYWIVPSHQLQSPVRSLRKGFWALVLFGTVGTFWAWAVPVPGGRMMRMLRPGGGGLGGGRGGQEAAALPSILFLWGLGQGASRFPGGCFGRTRAGGTGGAWGRKKGCVAWWLGSRSGNSAGVCMVAFTRLRVRSASFCMVSGGLWAMAVWVGCRRKGGGGGSSSWLLPA